MRSRLFLYLLFINSCLYGQEDTIAKKDISEVQVVITTLEVYEPSGRVLTRKEIDRNAPEDMGEVLRKLPGVNVKSYGGLGGLKVVSFRGLGAHHTNVSVDGFPLMNASVGQVNLGQLQTSNTESVVLLSGSLFSRYLPVSTQISGEGILINTTMMSFAADTHTVRVNAKAGSFGLYDGSALYKYSDSKKFISVFGKGRGANGNYPYSITNGNTMEEGMRRNNQYRDYYAGLSSGFKLKHGGFRVGLNIKNIDQELPGAVILYNETADESLKTEDYTINTDLYLRGEKSMFRLYSTSNLNNMVYRDPTYLNNDGFILNDYQSFNNSSGLLYGRETKSNVALISGLEYNYNRLESNALSEQQPERHRGYILIGAVYSIGLHKLTAKLVPQMIIDDPGNADPKNSHRLTSMLCYEKYRTLHRNRWHRLELKNTFRPPSFNELYYGNSGNTNLKPEDAYQATYKFDLHPLKKNDSWESGIALFGSYVKNKIIAIPTKNFFIWSIQNIGQTAGAGFDIIQSYQQELSSISSFNVRASYSYQRIMDITDRKGPTYLDQLAYMPVHSANFDLGYEYNGLGLNILNYYVSSRYVLNENIEANKEPGFLTTDLMIHYRMQFKRRSKLVIQAGVKNIFDVQYAYVRSYVMPGRNYLISLKYAIN